MKKNDILDIYLCITCNAVAGVQAEGVATAGEGLP